jgi:hypothetical protein
MASPSCLSLLRACAAAFLLLFLHGASAYVGGATISSTVLIVARDATAAENSAALGLRGYGIPYEILTVPQEGIPNLPVLYYSALTRRQWNDLYAYQSTFGIRMVRLDVFPTSDFGVTSNGGNLNDEPVTFTNISGFATVGLKT